MVKFLTSTAGGVGSILGWEAKIPHALWYIKKKKKRKKEKKIIIQFEHIHEKNRNICVLRTLGTSGGRGGPWPSPDLSCSIVHGGRGLDELVPQSLLQRGKVSEGCAGLPVIQLPHPRCLKQGRRGLGSLHGCSEFGQNIPLLWVSVSLPVKWE